MSNQWTPDSWKSKPVRQVPTYTDEAAVKSVEDELGIFPPLVFAGEARLLKKKLADVAEGRGFL
ncbi:MAG: 3-deoxy-7-phosphoheptulonate synthase, partial [Sneathiella sp.]